MLLLKDKMQQSNEVCLLCTVVSLTGKNKVWISVCTLDVDHASSESTYGKWRPGLCAQKSWCLLPRGSMSCHSVACSLFRMLFTFHSLSVSLVYLFAFFGFLLRKWHIFSTSTPPNRPSSKTQTRQERSVSPTASSDFFAIGLQTALNLYYLLTGPSDVCLCTTARKWKESPSLLVLSF